MDRRHLSIERASPPGHLADGRFGVGHGGTGSKATSPAPVARAPRKTVCPVASMARRSRSPLLASLLEQARPAHVGNFALAGIAHALLENRNVTHFFSSNFLRADRRRICRAVLRPGRERRRYRR